MSTLYKSMVIIIVLIGLWIALACTGHCEEPCHPGQHTCTTDASCEEEEAYFLDLDELHQSDTESIYDMPWVTKTTATPKQPATPTNLEVK